MTNPLRSFPFRPLPNAIRKTWRATLIAVSLVFPVALQAQETGIHDQPRSFDVFEQASGYQTFPPDRYGTLAAPKPNELGFLLMLRMLRSVCLGIESGAPLDTLMPQGFAAHNSAPYYFGPDAAPRGSTIVLSSTGDVELDEDGGHPAIWLEPQPQGLICSLKWQTPEKIAPDSQAAIATLIAKWLPWELALVPASRPQLTDQPALIDAFEWDRPCQTRWCPALAHFSLSRGQVSLQMTLNITRIEGERPD